MPDVRPTGDEEIRRQLISLVGKKGRRDHKWNKERPCDWRPEQVYDPESKVPLTAHAAWELIRHWLDENRPIETKTMTLADGREIEVYCMIEEFGDQMVYVKLEILGSGKSVFGWSFHISERTRKQEKT